MYNHLFLATKKRATKVNERNFCRSCLYNFISQLFSTLFVVVLSKQNVYLHRNIKNIEERLKVLHEHIFKRRQGFISSIFCIYLLQSSMRQSLKWETTTRSVQSRPVFASLRCVRVRSSASCNFIRVFNLIHTQIFINSISHGVILLGVQTIMTNFLTYQLNI